MSSKQKTLTVQQQWDRFERWHRRLTAVSDSYLDRLSEEADGYPDVEKLLYVAESHEWIGREDYDSSLVLQAAPFRIRAKIEFVQAYFRDVSFDGAEFMGQFASFLPYQYPSRCESCYAIWFEQADESLDDTWTFGCALFVPSIESIDYFSAMEILPFDFLRIRAPRGVPWSKHQVRSTREYIQNDLAQDGLDFNISARRRGSEILEFKLTAAEPED